MPGVLLVEITSEQARRWEQPLWDAGWFTWRLTRPQELDQALRSGVFQVGVTASARLGRALANRALPVVLCVTDVTSMARAWEWRAGDPPIAIVPFAITGPALGEHVRGLLGSHQGDRLLLGAPSRNAAAALTGV